MTLTNADFELNSNRCQIVGNGGGLKLIPSKTRSNLATNHF